MKKKIIAILIIIILISQLTAIKVVKAEDNFNTDEEISDTYNYEENEIEDEEDETSFEHQTDNTEELDDEINSKKSIGVVLVEIFCGLVGIFMVILAFKTSE